MLTANGSNVASEIKNHWTKQVLWSAMLANRCKLEHGRNHYRNINTVNHLEPPLGHSVWNEAGHRGLNHVAAFTGLEPNDVTYK